MKYTDFFDLIHSGKETPVAALFMTYGFDAELFEYYVLPHFLGIIGSPDDERDISRFRQYIAVKLKEVPVTVLSDAKQYHGGRTFLYDHITISEHTFHPKCYFLLYQTYLRVIIASCNVTRSGLCYNAETVWYEDIVLDQPCAISKGLSNILSWMVERYALQGNEAVEEITKFLEKINHSSNNPRLLSTIHNSNVFSQLFSVLEGLKDNCQDLSIVSPFFENDLDRAMEKSLLLEFADKFKTMCPNAKIKIYFPVIERTAGEYRVSAPVNIFEELCKKYTDTELYVINSEWEREDDEPVPRQLHAKIILVNLTGDKKLILSGSINFTNHAMRSRIGALRNIEVGVLEYGKITFRLPQSIRVKVNELIYKDKNVSENGIVIFVKNAVLDGEKLTINLKEDKNIPPYKIRYQESPIFESNHYQETIVLELFKLGKSQDLHIECPEYDFFVPIQVLRKEELVTEDLKLSFKLNFKDIIDFLAGKYKSLNEIARLKRILKVNELEAAGGLAIYFRHNLQRYYKAMASLKQGLELPYYSRMAFRNYISNPIGLENLLQCLLEDYNKGFAGNEETFLFVVEIENVIRHLQYQEDRLEKAIKDQELGKIMKEPISIRKKIYSKANKKIRNQYDVMLKTYGLEVK